MQRNGTQLLDAAELVSLRELYVLIAARRRRVEGAMTREQGKPEPDQPESGDEADTANGEGSSGPVQGRHLTGERQAAENRSNEPPA